MTDQEFIDFVKLQPTMAIAAAALGISFSTFARKAKRLNCYLPNQGSKGLKRSLSHRHVPLNEIFAGKHPQIQSFKLKNKLYKANLKQNKCEICNISEWNGKEIKCELDHIDGDKTNNALENLRILCPNCHSQTSTFRFKRGRGENGKHKALKMPTSTGSNPVVRTNP